MTEPLAKIFIVDDDASVSRALKRLLTGAGYEVEVFTSAATYLAREPYDGVGCLLLDLQMPNMSGIELQERLTKLERDMPIVFLTAHGDIPTGVKAVKQGAVDFLTKPIDESALFLAIKAALVRHRQSIEVRLLRSSIETRISALTAREHEVMRYVIGGALNKQIALSLGISEKTVKAHRGQVMQKMAASSVAALVRQCEAAGIAPKQIP